MSISSGTLQEARDACAAGYTCSPLQKACAAGRIVGDALQTINSMTETILEVKSTRFDDPTPMISGNNILLDNQQKIYGVSCSITGSQPTHTTGVLTLNLYWFDGTSSKLIMSQDFIFLDTQSTINACLASACKTNARNDNYIYATLYNGTNASIDITRFRFSAVRAC